jgi:hypothetical protein
MQTWQKKLGSLTLSLAIGLSFTNTAQSAVKRINQLRALAGGITPGDTPGFPVTISQPGSYRLTSNLILPATTGTVGILVTAQSVTIDLDGFAVIGPRVCPDDMTALCPPSIEDATYIGIQAGDNVTIMNGTVRGTGGTGISVGSHARIEGVNIIWNSIFGVLAGRGTALNDNLIAQNGQGVLIGDDCTIIGNRVRANTFFGIQITGPNTGHKENVISCTSPGTCISGGFAIGLSLCNGGPCP